MIRNPSILRKDSNDNLKIEDLLNNEYLSHFIDLNAFQSITISRNHVTAQAIQTQENKQQQNNYKTKIKSNKNFSSFSQNQQISQPLTTLLSIKKQGNQIQRHNISNSPQSSLKNNYKIHEMFKIDQFLNNKKQSQNSNYKINLSSLQDNDIIDEICDTQTMPQSDFIKYTLTDKNGSQSARSKQSKKYNSPRIEQKISFNTLNQELQNIISPKSIINKVIYQQKVILGSDSFIQPQRVLKPIHKVSTSLSVQPNIKFNVSNTLNSAKNTTQIIGKKGIQINQTSPKYRNNSNLLQKEKQFSDPTLIINLLENEKNQDNKLTQNYDNSLKVKLDLENNRRISIQFQSHLDKQEEEQKQKLMKKVLYQQQESDRGKISQENSLNDKNINYNDQQKLEQNKSTENLLKVNNKNSQEKVEIKKIREDRCSKLSITNPLFTEIDKSSLLDKSQLNFMQQWQLKQKQKNDTFNQKSKYRIQSAQSKLQDKRNSSPNPLISSSFYGTAKDSSSNILENTKQFQNKNSIQNTNQLSSANLNSNFKQQNNKKNQNYVTQNNQQLIQIQNNDQFSNSNDYQSNKQFQNIISIQNSIQQLNPCQLQNPSSLQNSNQQQNANQQNNNIGNVINNTGYNQSPIQFQNPILTQNVGNQLQKIFQYQNINSGNNHEQKEENNSSHQQSIYLQQGDSNYFQKNESTFNNLNQSLETQIQVRKISANQFKQMIHPELQSFNSLQKKSSKDLTSKIQSQSIIQNSNKLQNNKKQIPLNNSQTKNYPILSQEIQLQKSKSIEDEEKYFKDENYLKDQKHTKKDKAIKDQKNIKEATSNLAIYKYSSNNYRPQTAKVFGQESLTKKQKNKQIRSFNSLKSWENNDNDDQSVLI